MAEVKKNKPKSVEPVYRQEAIVAHRRGRELAQSPNFMAGRTIAIIWSVALISLGLTAGLLLAPVPIYVTGSAVAISSQHLPETAHDGELALLLFFSPSVRDQLRDGQRVFIRTGQSRTRVETILTRVDKTVTSPLKVAQQFNTSGQGPTAPSICAFASFEPPRMTAAASWFGSTFRAEVEVGEERLLARLPIFEWL